MKRVARLPGTADEIRNEFLVYWIRQKGFYYKVPNYRVLAAALRVLLPPYHSQTPIQIYRGANTEEHERRAYGFSWTTKIETAKSFARGRGH
jgi:hypothetical protein